MPLITVLVASQHCKGELLSGTKVSKHNTPFLPTRKLEFICCCLEQCWMLSQARKVTRNGKPSFGDDVEVYAYEKPCSRPSTNTSTSKIWAITEKCRSTLSNQRLPCPSSFQCIRIRKCHLLVLHCACGWPVLANNSSIVLHIWDRGNRCHDFDARLR